MNNTTVINVNNPVEIRRVGIVALREALGPVGMAKFMQQFEMGIGNYTKEKYEQPELTLAEIDAMLQN